MNIESKKGSMILAILRAMSRVDGMVEMHLIHDPSDTDVTYWVSIGLMLAFDTWLGNYRVGYDVRKNIYLIQFDGHVVIGGTRESVQEIICGFWDSDPVVTAEYLLSGAKAHRKRLKEEGRVS